MKPTYSTEQKPEAQGSQRISQAHSTTGSSSLGLLLLMKGARTLTQKIFPEIKSGLYLTLHSTVSPRNTREMCRDCDKNATALLFHL